MLRPRLLQLNRLYGDVTRQIEIDTAADGRREVILGRSQPWCSRTGVEAIRESLAAHEDLHVRSKARLAPVEPRSEEILERRVSQLDAAGVTDVVSAEVRDQTENLAQIVLDIAITAIRVA